MKSGIQKLMQKFKNTNITIIEAAFVKAYLEKKKINFDNSRFICRYIEIVKDRDTELYRYIFDSFHFGQIDDLISIFELLLDSEDKKMNGMIYTPYHIKKYIIEHVIVQNETPKVVDPACGCGSFLLTAAQFLKKKYGLSYKEIFGSYVVGFDIDGHSTEKAKVLFNILSLEEEGISIENGCELYTVNSLQELSKKAYKNRYDVVIGNPPYVRAKNMERQVKESVKLWSVVSGNVDLYIPFYQLAVEILKPDGIMGYISPNTFLQSVNGRGLRNYLVDCGYKTAILDFRETKMFQDISHYTCICLIFKGESTYKLDYALLNGESSLDKYEFTTYNIKNYPVNKEWRFGNNCIDGIIKKIESQPRRLNDYKIRNGLATLKNDLYFFSVTRMDENYYYRVYKGEEVAIEKEICISVAKPNIMRTETDLEEKIEKGIFPYKAGGEIIDEDELSLKYPKAYNFLLSNKQLLLERDKGKAKDYLIWYAYGRTQGMNNQGKKLLIPYMAERGVAIESKEESLLFYCGYALFFSDDMEMTLVKRLIESKVFWYYIKNTSKPYSKGYMALAKNYIKDFGVPDMTDRQKHLLLKMEQGDEREKMIADLYRVPYEMVR